MLKEGHHGRLQFICQSYLVNYYCQYYVDQDIHHRWSKGLEVCIRAHMDLDHLILTFKKRLLEFLGSIFYPQKYSVSLFMEIIDPPLYLIKKGLQ